ncbi:uncharacterized protein IUM83_11570 [Phytophthora cinnamomi]|uniref:uncharacterized protein n=1 Tax=Phytophthora cinnamomi TaxID=4785 RepID=UPI00355A9FA4|nr:hypothetical protein IUM83_11570 [Phytophthora cinnamomi]
MSPALYAPSDKSGVRRKQNSNAIQARPIFLNMNLMTFGYYGLLDHFENKTHDNLMWLDGTAAPRSSAMNANTETLTPQRNRRPTAAVYRNDGARSENTIGRALDQCRVDEDGCRFIPEILGESQALASKRPEVEGDDLLMV